MRHVPKKSNNFSDASFEVLLIMFDRGYNVNDITKGAFIAASSSIRADIKTNHRTK